MESRLLLAALWRRRARALVAVVAIAVGSSVPSALFHVSADISRKVSGELRALGPNLLLLPRSPHPSAPEGSSGRGYLEEVDTRARLRSAGVQGALLLYVVARVNGQMVQLVGADLEVARRLHPTWVVGERGPRSFMGSRLKERLGVRTGERLQVSVGGRSAWLSAGPTLEAGGPDGDAWWVPLDQAQSLAGVEGTASLAQVRIEPGQASSRIEAALGRGGDVEAVPLHALSVTEADLLVRMRRLTTFVTLAALIAAGLCAFGTLADLALERRREIAVLKSLGAGPRDIVRRWLTESFVIGASGGLAGWLAGVALAQLIGRQVFDSGIALRWDVPVVVVALALLVAGLAAIWPIRMALRVEPAVALKGD